MITRIITVMMVVLMSIDFHPCRAEKETPETAVEQETEACPEKSTEKGTASTIYRIHGTTPPGEWQKALRTELKRAGIEWYMPYAVCQVWQESRWNAKADNGKDRGITQQKAVYWAARASRYGVGGADIWNVNAQFRVFASMMGGYLKATNNDIGWALSYYFYGSGAYAEKYVADVMSHLPHLEEVK